MPQDIKEKYNLAKDYSLCTYLPSTMSETIIEEVYSQPISLALEHPVWYHDTLLGHVLKNQ